MEIYEFSIQIYENLVKKSLVFEMKDRKYRCKICMDHCTNGKCKFRSDKVFNQYNFI